MAGTAGGRSTGMIIYLCAVQSTGKRLDKVYTLGACVHGYCIVVSLCVALT